MCYEVGRIIVEQKGCASEHYFQDGKLFCDRYFVPRTEVSAYILFQIIRRQIGGGHYGRESKKRLLHRVQEKDQVPFAEEGHRKNIRDKKYTFTITVAVCAECGEEMSISGLIDKNIQEIEDQHRATKGIVSIDDVERLMKIYKIGKAPPVPGAWVWRGDDSEIFGRAGAFQRVFRYH